MKLLAVDVGNSRVKLGLFDGEDLTTRDDCPTGGPAEPGMIRSLLRRAGARRLDGAAICSVVPAATRAWTEAVQEAIGSAPYVIGPETDFGLEIVPQPPDAVGRDRLVNAVAAREKHGSPCIVVDIGTATTVDAVSTDGAFLGGAIAPGPTAMARSLHTATSQLPLVELDIPSRAIGLNTTEALLSGIAYGYRGLIRGLTEQIACELVRIDSRSSNSSVGVVLTGGWSEFFYYDLSIYDASLGLTFDGELTLDGIRLVWRRNQRSTPGGLSTQRPDDPLPPLNA